VESSQAGWPQVQYSRLLASSSSSTVAADVLCATVEQCSYSTLSAFWGDLRITKCDVNVI
jgi:hypothetical protein